MATLERMQGLDLGVATEFLLIAAVLLGSEGWRLLPDSSGTDSDDELALWEERDLLLARLLECKTFKDASVAMSRLMEVAERSVPRRAGLEERFVGLAPDPLEGLESGHSPGRAVETAGAQTAGQGQHRPRGTRAGQRGGHSRGTAGAPAV